MAFAIPWRLCLSQYQTTKRIGATNSVSFKDLDDIRLVDLAQAGEISAFEELVRRYRNDVFSFAYHFVHNREDAWDISQEVFVKTHRSLAGFRKEASFKTWLMRITSNQCKDFLKTTRKNTFSLDTAGQLKDERAGIDPKTSLENKELELAIMEALNEMPFKHRTAFILREMEQLSYKEMADIMKCNIGTVMSRLHHARRKIRDKLVQRGFSPE